MIWNIFNNFKLPQMTKEDKGKNKSDARKEFKFGLKHEEKP